MDVCIFYFSSTGNTWWTGYRLVEELQIKGRTAECHSIEMLDEEKTSKLIETSEAVFFGYPVYGSYIPEPMKEFIDNIKEPSKTKKAGIFCTQMKASGDGAWFYHKVLEDKGFEIRWTFHFNLPNNISMKISPVLYTIEKSKLDKIFNKCEIKIEKAANSIAMNAPSLTGNGFIGFLMGLMQRPFFKHYMKRPFKSPYKVDPDKCVNCMRCIQICPEGNIKLVDGKIKYGDNCAMCMRCYNYCPKTAISAFGFAHNDKKKPYRGPEGFDPALITKRKDLMDFIE